VGSAIVTENDALAVAPALSFTVTDTWKVPAEVGVPEKLVPLKLTPAGEPLALQVYGAVPPVAATPAE
jgi:hypothetical protein